VAVEKLGFSEKTRTSGDRKCPGDWEKSLVELPDAIQFLQIPSERVFQQPQGLSLAISECDDSQIAGAKRSGWRKSLCDWRLELNERASRNV
jgi:hypothetical protein